ncbi:hypothetical protein [uncultured Kriegella sp.]|uniref:hypothetical protein n=1 Tax=uncultured Kriegella sp. TaxID=1798910 RepID=UPI0030DBFEB8|tara:strand:- start:158292 stop:158702 length:411 start_codon:yes stop_codon:yes gene_type:complete
MKNFERQQSPAKNTYGSDSGIIDLKPLLEECMGDVDMLKELIGLYKKNILEFIGKAKIHIANQDYERLQFATHKLKCSLLLLKTEDLFSIVEKMHCICVDQEGVDKLTVLYQSFLDSYPLIEGVIDEQFFNLISDE